MFGACLEIQVTGVNLHSYNTVLFLVLSLLAVSHNAGSINPRLLLFRTKQIFPLCLLHREEHESGQTSPPLRGSCQVSVTVAQVTNPRVTLFYSIVKIREHLQRSSVTGADSQKEVVSRGYYDLLAIFHRKEEKNECKGPSVLTSLRQKLDMRASKGFPQIYPCLVFLLVYL